MESSGGIIATEKRSAATKVLVVAVSALGCALAVAFAVRLVLDP